MNDYASLSDSAFIEFFHEKRKIRDHTIDSVNLLIFILLIILVTLTIWLFKYKRFPYVHETGLGIVYGAVFGIIIRYGFTPINKKTIQLTAISSKTNKSIENFNELPDYVHLKIGNHTQMFDYMYRGPARSETQQDYEEKATFDPEIFFNILLPPIIFHAGYCMKRRHFFKNFGGIVAFAFFGTTISAFFIGGFMYMVVSISSSIRKYFSFTDCLFFGALVSATDPVTVLAIFNDKKVDVNLYALVFGESVLNDAVSIVLAQAIEKYSVSLNSDRFDVKNFFECIGNFVVVFTGAFGIGSLMGCTTALLTKFTRIREHQLLETALFILMSYSTFLASEAAGLTGIVAVLFCGIFQAHYTFNNLSKESQEQTKGIFNLLNFLSENFIFVYIGISLFTFRYHRWEAPFIIASFPAVFLARAFNIYPISYLLNIARRNKITTNMQHMMVFSGLRGAMAFALAIRNTSTKARQLILTTTLVIVIVTVFICGGLTQTMLNLLKIKTDMEDEPINEQTVKSSNTNEDFEDTSITYYPSKLQKLFKSFSVFRVWHGFDKYYVKPFLTNSRPTLIDTMPKFCLPIARILTTDEQFSRPTHDVIPSRYSMMRDDLITTQNEFGHTNDILIQIETI